MAGKSKSELKRQINRWLNAGDNQAGDLFLIGFGLDMDDKMLTKFLTLVLKESDFDFMIRRKSFSGIADIQESLIRQQ